MLSRSSKREEDDAASIASSGSSDDDKEYQLPYNNISQESLKSCSHSEKESSSSENPESVSVLHDLFVEKNNFVWNAVPPHQGSLEQGMRRLKRAYITAMIGTDDGRSSNSQKVTQLSIREFKKALHDVEPMTTWESSSVRHIDSSKKITSEKSKNPNESFPELDTEAMELEEQKQYTEISGRRIVDIAHFFMSLKAVQHDGFGCSFFDIDLVGERRKGFVSIWKIMSDNNSASSADEASTNSSKKRRRNSSDWNVNKRKLARQEGREYVTIKGVTVPGKKVEPPCTCKRKCIDSLCEQDKVQILSKLYTDTSKNLQDTFLQGLMEIKPIERRRKRLTESAKQRSYYGSAIVCRKTIYRHRAKWNNKALNIKLLDTINSGTSDLSRAL
ncbi:hypothetical protein RN001_004627 [Aquatica leii]|uniref:Uncharacterized protein n=1 Tax=Aquatica leii TaxID=1421715 RepID=A0AAN7SPL4_9COLE|nr:hypothetical protein RN001_004627 [Aquatica leii]